MAPLRGRFFLAEAALLEAERLLPTYRGPDGDHEGILFLLGREFEQAVLFVGILAAEADHGPQHVICSPDQVAAASRAARSAGLALLGQIHSHPGGMTWHSSGDDDLVLMPYERMLSIVVPHYARFGLRPLDSLGVHQFDCITCRIRAGAPRLRCSASTVEAVGREVDATLPFLSAAAGLMLAAALARLSAGALLERPYNFAALDLGAPQSRFQELVQSCKAGCRSRLDRATRRAMDGTSRWAKPRLDVVIESSSMAEPCRGSR